MTEIVGTTLYSVQYSLQEMVKNLLTWNLRQKNFQVPLDSITSRIYCNIKYNLKVLQ
jgi:hypothetical protein